MAIIITIAVSVITLAIVGGVFIAGEREPVVTVHTDRVHIGGMYGTTVRFDRLVGVTLLEDNMANIGMGRRRSGYAGFTSIRKGRFDAGLLFVDAGQAPTLLIERTGSSNPYIYISFRDPQATRALYSELRKALMP